MNFFGQPGGADLEPPPFLLQFQQVAENLALGLVSNRVRVRALIELLEEKGLLAPGQYDQRAEAVWERDYDQLAQELTTPPPPPPEPATPPQPAPATYDRHYAEALAAFVDDAVATRVRVRTIIELLEQSGALAPGEFDRKADAVWERDYEELALEFYGGRY